MIVPLGRIACLINYIQQNEPRERRGIFEILNRISYLRLTEILASSKNPNF